MGRRKSRNERREIGEGGRTDRQTETERERERDRDRQINRQTDRQRQRENLKTLILEDRYQSLLCYKHIIKSTTIIILQIHN